MYSGKIPVHRRFNYSSCGIVSAERDYWTLRSWTRAEQSVRGEQRKHFVTMLREPYARLLSQFDHNQVSICICYIAIIRYLQQTGACIQLAMTTIALFYVQRVSYTQSLERVAVEQSIVPCSHIVLATSSCAVLNKTDLYHFHRCISFTHDSTGKQQSGSTAAHYMMC
jgi:hypothetical protein